MSTLIDIARKMRPLIEKAAESLTDKEASEAPMMFRRLKYDNSYVEPKTRICWKNIVMKSTSGLWDTELNNPDNAPTLWEAIPYKDGIRIIPEVITVTSVFELGEKGWWKNHLYESLISVNSTNPETYPDGWKLVE